MDFKLKEAMSFNDFVNVTHEINSNSGNNVNIELNMATVLFLKNVKFFEIEYFIKYLENGVAFIIFERILILPTSRSWCLLGKELIALLLYWLEAVRKHLIIHCNHWWLFLCPLLNFIKQIRKKDPSLPNVLIQELAGCLLDLTSGDRLDVQQQYQVLHCLSVCGAESSREVRCATRDKLEHYFIKLSAKLAMCSYFPTQYIMLDILLRWLVKRRDSVERSTTASKWFPSHFYSKSSVDVFVERQWINFLQDARAFLNCHNSTNSLVTSVECKKILFRDTAVVSGAPEWPNWLDINLENSITLMVEMNSGHDGYSFLTIAYDNVDAVNLYRLSSEVVISIKKSNCPMVLPSCEPFSADSVNITISPTSDMSKVVAALSATYRDKYREQGARLPVQTRMRTGFVTMSNAPLNCNTPSSASTSSLAQLREKLNNIPNYIFKKREGVCLPPDLSCITEVSEIDEKSIKAESSQHNETQAECRGVVTKKVMHSGYSDRKSINKSIYEKLSSPGINQDSASFVLPDTEQLDDVFIINDSFEQFRKNEKSNLGLVDLIIQEALETARNKTQDETENKVITKYTPQHQQNLKKEKSATKTKKGENVKKKRQINKRTKGQILTEDSITTDIVNDDDTTKEDVTKNSYTEIKIPPALRKKRKLYSPLDIEKTIIGDKTIVHIPETEDDDTVLSQISAKKLKSSKSLATSYEEIEKERRNTKKLLKNKKNKISTTTMSPKFFKLNNMEDNEPVSKGGDCKYDMTVYDFPNNSEDEDFKKKNLEIKNKRTRNRSIQSINSVNDTSNSAKKSCKAKNDINQKRGKRTKITLANKLQDEKIRDNGSEILNTSLIENRDLDRDLDKEPQPHLLTSPQMETILKDNDRVDIINEENEKSIKDPVQITKKHKADKTVGTKECIAMRHEMIKNKNKKNNSNKKVCSEKKSKDQKVSTENKSKDQTRHLNTKNVEEVVNNTESPLPELVMEIEPSNIPNDSITDNISQNFIQIFEDGNTYRCDKNVTNNTWKSNSSSVTSIKRLGSNKINSSPLDSLTRLSDQELRKWLPPQSDDSSEKSEKVINKTNSHKEVSPIIELETLSKMKLKIKPPSIISPIKLTWSPVEQNPGKPPITFYTTCSNENNLNFDIDSYVPKSSTPDNLDCTLLENLSNQSHKSKGERETDYVGVITKKMEISEDLTSSTRKSSVQKWFSKLPEKYTGNSSKDYLEYVLEKLATLQKVIDHNTAKSFSITLANNEKALRLMRDLQKEMFRETAKGITSVILKNINEQFANLGNRSKKLHEDIKENFKKQAREIVIEDFKKRETLMNILREDIEAIIEIEKHNLV